MTNSRKSSGWTVEYSKAAVRLLDKLPKAAQKKIMAGLEGIILEGQDPYASGKALHGTERGHWRYRFGDYRVVCRIENQAVKVLVLNIGHRREVYR